MVVASTPFGRGFTGMSEIAPIQRSDLPLSGIESISRGAGRSCNQSEEKKTDYGCIALVLL